MQRWVRSGGERAQSGLETLWAYPAPKGSREPEIRDEEGETERRGWEAQIRDNRPGERDRSEMTSGPLSESLMI